MNTVNQSPETGKPESANPLYEFGPFVLDSGRRLLSRELQPVPLTPKTYDVLLVLVESGGRFLSKSELLKSLWPDSFVEESNLTQQISTIRKALGESPGEDRYIVTVPGRGYRFAAPVSLRANRASVDAAESIPSEAQKTAGGPAQIAAADPNVNDPAVNDPAVNVPATVDSPTLPRASGQLVGDSHWSPERRVVLAVLLAVILLALGYILNRKPAAGTSSSARPKSLAILPFRNLKNDAASDFLGFSLADAVVAKLSSLSELTVRPSSAVERYRNQVIDFQKIAAELNVDSLLTGNFIRDGDDLRITSELIDVRTQRILWKRAFNLKYEKLLTVQESVAQQIVNGLALHLSPSEVRQLKADRPLDPLAYEFYLRGVDIYARGEFPLAIEMLEKSAELNPNYALTWAHLGKAYDANASFQFGGREQYRKAQAAYERALSLQPTQIETRVYMANMFTDTGRVEQAMPLLRQALKTNPNHPEAHWELGYAYRFAGALQESLVECELARQLDPGVKLNSSALNTYLYLGQYDKFLQALPKGDEVPLIVFYRGFGEYYSRQWPQAAADFDRAFQLDHSLLQAQVGKALSYCINRQCARGLDLLRTAEDKIKERGVTDPEAIYKIAQAYGILGDHPSALRVLRSSILSGFFSYPYLAKDPLLDGLRVESEFQPLIAAARLRHEAFRKKFL